MRHERDRSPAPTSQLYDWQREAIDELVDRQRAGARRRADGRRQVHVLTSSQPSISTGIALVITPLVALMADQVASLTARGIPATYLASNLDGRREPPPHRAGARRRGEAAVHRAGAAGVGVRSSKTCSRSCRSRCSPSTKRTASATGATTSGRLPAASANSSQRLQPQRLLACTATATPAVRQEIVERLDMPDAHQMLRGFARHNLRLARRRGERPEGEGEAHRRRGEARARRSRTPGNGTALVYTGSRKNAEDVAEAMRALGWRADHYHAGMSGPGAQRRAGEVPVGHARRRRRDERVRHGHRPAGHPARRAPRAAGVGRGVLPGGRPRRTRRRAGRGAAADLRSRHRAALPPDRAATSSSAPEQALRRRELLRAMIGYAETSACRHDSHPRVLRGRGRGAGRLQPVRQLRRRRRGPPERRAGRSGVGGRGARRARRRSAGCRSRSGRARSPLPHRPRLGADPEVRLADAAAVRRAASTGARTGCGACCGGWSRRGLLALEPEQQTLHLTRRAVDVIAGARPNPVRLPPNERPTLRVGAPRPAIGGEHARRRCGDAVRAAEAVAPPARRRGGRARVRHLPRRDARGDRRARPVVRR